MLPLGTVEIEREPSKITEATVITEDKGARSEATLMDAEVKHIGGVRFGVEAVLTLEVTETIEEDMAEEIIREPEVEPHITSAIKTGGKTD